jgi:hypothetical protein
VKRDPIQPGIEAVRHNGLLMLLLIGAAFVMVGSYYASPNAQQILATGKSWRGQIGPLFPAISTPIATVFIPELMKRLILKERSGRADLLFQVGFFALMGLLVDSFYQLLSLWLGAGTDPGTVITKIVVDQLGFTPLLALPYGLLAFAWRDAGFRVSGAAAALSGGEYTYQFVSRQLTGWTFWVPVVTAIYSLPADLQFWLFLFGQAAWSLVWVRMAAVSAAR